MLITHPFLLLSIQTTLIITNVIQLKKDVKVIICWDIFTNTLKNKKAPDKLRSWFVRKDDVH
jgi:hypothetical protein